MTVSVETLARHPLYKKRVRRSKRFMVHDEGNEARVGDTVRIIETRPLSARKRGGREHSLEGRVVIQQESRLKVADNSGPGAPDHPRARRAASAGARASGT